MTRIRGTIVQLRSARPFDRRDMYSWLAQSDVTASMMGPPTYPESLPPTWEEFCADYGPHFFDGSIPDVAASYLIEVSGEPVGQVNYEVRESLVRLAELDIWLRSEADTGHGYGPDALTALTAWLHATLGIDRFLIRPSARNHRAIRAYQKAGFATVRMSWQQQVETYGAGDYTDTVVMILQCSADGVAMSDLHGDLGELQGLLRKGSVQRAYGTIVGYMSQLRAQYATALGERAVSGLYQGYFDMTYFGLSPDALKSRGLKLALVFNYEAFGFEVWLAARNRTLQRKYWKLLADNGWAKYRLVDPGAGIDAIVAYEVATAFELEERPQLTSRIMAASKALLAELDSFLADHDPQ
jgi:RimJ/RimL family protein N-acetyltransferase